MGFQSVKNRFKDVKKKIEEEKSSSNSYGNESFFKPQAVKGEDKTKFRLRILDLGEESTVGRPWMKIFYHMFEREGDSRYVKCIDPRTFDKDAENPIADLASQLYSSDNAMDKKQASKLYRKPRFFLKVLVKEAPDDQLEYVGKVLVYEASKTIYDKMIDEIEETDLDDAPFWDPFEGKDFILAIKTKTEANGRTWPDYSDSKFVGKEKPIVDDEEEMDKIYGLVTAMSVKEEVLKRDSILTGPQLKAILEGGLNGDDAPVDTSSATNLTDDMDELDDSSIDDDMLDSSSDETSDSSTVDETDSSTDEISLDDLDVDLSDDDIDI